MPLITPLPTPPSRADATNFDTRADAFLGALPTFQSEANTVATNMETQYNFVAANVSTTTTNAAQATSAANSAVTARNQIEVLFLGSKSSNPTTNNQGGALTVGCKYFNTTVSEDRVWTGTNWVAGTALGGTVAGLNVDGLLKLKANTWHVDSFDTQRIYLENDGAGNGLRTILRGNEFNYWNNAGIEMFKVVNDGRMFSVGQASLNANGTFMSGHSVTIGGTTGGGNTVGFGTTAGGAGSLGQVGADSNHLFLGPNTYYALGNDRFSVSGAYAPKIRMFASDNRILFQQTNSDVQGNAQTQYNVAEFDAGGTFIVRSRDSNGYAAIQGGGTGNAGFIGFHRPNGERTGYVGYAANAANSVNLIVSDNNHPWVFANKAPQSDTDATGSQELPRLSQFPVSATANGYTRLPNGFIIQWGTVTIGSAGTNITLPITFPTACTSVLASCTTNNLARASIINTSTINVACNPSTPQLCYWIAVGY
jgi:hypothetical protein